MPQPEAFQTEQVFLSYSHTDREACITLRAALEKGGFSVFQDVESLRAGDRWMEGLQKEIEGCSAFVVLVGCDGVQRWVGAETQAALNRHFSAHHDQRLPIFPILLGNTAPDTLPAFLRLFQATAWNGTDLLPAQLLDAIRDRAIVTNPTLTIDGPPFVGLNAYLPDQAQLFFGRQKETLDALSCFDTRAGGATVRWLEINGNSGSGKSSLMSAGLLPLVDQGWLWPRTGYERWRRIGPLMPGEDPVQMLAEHLTRSFGGLELTDVRERLERGDERALAEWLRTRKQSDKEAFLLAVDQFEELFTFADPKKRARFDSLLATALADSACPLFVVSTVRADFLDRFEDLPRLLAVRNRLGKAWTLPAISGEALREVIDGPARLAGADVSEVREAIVSQALDEPGALPLVENALHWLWEQRQKDPQSGKLRLSGKLFTAQGGLAGILSRSADDLLDRLGKQRERALELLFRLVKVDPEGLRHTRRPIPLAEAVAVAGGGDAGRGLVNVLAGGRTPDGGKAHGPLRLITVTTTGEATANVEAEDPAGKEAGWVNLIHETLIRSKGSSAEAKPQPYWPTLWNYVDQHKERAAQREHLQLLARQWKERKGLARLFGLVGWLDLFGFRGLAAPGSQEQRYLRWSMARALVTAGVVALVVGVAGESVYWAKAHDLPLESVTARWAYKLGKTLPMPELAQVPAGEFEMGEHGQEEAVHRVTVARPFYLGKTEITFAQYDAFCEATARACPDGPWGRDDQPVIYVSWSDARAYADWLSAMTSKACRLPSEAEWEYAARAGTTTRYPWGDDPDSGRANFSGSGSRWSGKQTAPVGRFAPNRWGLYDTSGNVWEWVEDCWRGSYKGAPDDGRAWLGENGGRCLARVLRGGSWSNGAGNARSAARYHYSPGYRHYFIGFRVLCSSSIE